MAASIPFAERKTPWRGIIDLATGCYPGFLFGASTQGILPVFHFHDVTPSYLEPYLAYLADNGYTTVTSEAVTAFARNGTDPGQNKVVLTFDDAWLSLWTVVVPLLQKYKFTAIAYVSPGRIPEAERLRPTMLAANWQPAPPEHYAFASWPELKAIHDSGTVDLQAHTYSHSTIFCDSAITGFVTPSYCPPLHLRPLLNTGDKAWRYASADDLGCPLYQQRSRMSDALRFFEPAAARERCLAAVNTGGGAGFFDRPDWQSLLREAAGTAPGRSETPEQQRAAIREELTHARETLSARLGGHKVRHMCFPFSICGRVAESLLAETGYESAFGDRLFGSRAVKHGGNPYRLMRLKHHFIFCLPGKGRRGFLAAWKSSKGSGGQA